MQVGGGARSRYNDGRMLAFRLGAAGSIPEPVAPEVDIPPLPPLTASEEQIRQGAELYYEHCVWCHGMGPVGMVNADLRLMTAETHERFAAIVRGGMLLDKGMDSFADVLDAEQAELVHQFVISRAMAARREIEARPDGADSDASPERGEEATPSG